MAIHTEQEHEVGGFQKEIEESAKEVMLDVLQKYQYQFPHRSAIRELVSNSLDAIREKHIATQIITGKAKEEDYFIRRNDPLYKDSNFDPQYYNLDWLWLIQQDGDRWDPRGDRLYAKDPNKVHITYEDGGETRKDRLLIEDFGTGMGGRRVEKYFHLGYSSKRNTIHALGKFGIGAKAGLAAASFYTMTTRYNGKEYSFNIYPHNIQSIVPEWNTETGKRNGLHIFQNRAKIWYRETTLPNGTIIELESKKHHKQMYIDAVKSQLLYFDNIVLRVRNQHGGLDIVPHQAEILYEDDHIILSDNTQYSKPHLLIGKINYGNVDFKELELEDKQGNIGIKVAAEEVTVNPSRESLMWDELTRETVVKAFTKVVKIAEHIVGQQMKKDDFLEWVRACSEIKGRFGGDTVVGRLSKVVDLSGVEIPYSKDPTIVYGQKLFMGLSIRLNTLSEEREGSVVRYRITRAGISSVSFDNTLPVLAQISGVSFKKDKYLLTDVYPDGFISFQVPFSSEEEVRKLLSEAMPDNIDLPPAMRNALEHYPKLMREELVAHMTKVSSYMLASKDTITYEDIVVPEDFDDSEEVTREDEQAQTEEGKQSRKDRQKLIREKGVIPIFTPRNVTSSYITSKEKNSNRLWDWQKLELPVEDIDKWDESEVYYATEAKIGKDEDGKDIIEAELLHIAAAITRPSNELVHKWPDKFDIKAIMPEYVKMPSTPGTPDWQSTHPSYAGIKPTGANTVLVVPLMVYNTAQREWERIHNFFGKVKLIKVAQDRRKFFLDFKPIQRFFLDIKGKTLTMSNALVRWNTARVMNDQLWKLKFLNNFDVFDNKAWTTYHNVKRYVDHNYRELKDHSKDNRYYGLRDSSYEDLVTHCDKLMKFQLLVRDSKDNPTLIAAAAQELFAPQQEITDGLAIDLTFYDSFKELLEYAEPIYVLLNEIPKLTGATGGGSNYDISNELELEIRSYLGSKGVEGFNTMPMTRKQVLDGIAPVDQTLEEDEGYQTSDKFEGGAN